MILDAELLGMVEAFLDPVVVDDDTLASRRWGGRPGRPLLRRPHTQSRFKTAFHKPMLSDWRNYETWEEAGSPERPARPTGSGRSSSRRTSHRRSTRPIREELDAFVDRRVAEGGVPTDF